MSSSFPAKRALGQRLFAAVAAVALLMAPTVAAAAQDSSTTEADAAEISVTAAPGNSGVVPTVGQVSMAVQVTNASSDRIAAPELQVEVGGTPLTTESAVSTWLSGGGNLDAAVTATTTTLLPIERYSTSASVIAVDPSVVAALTPGVYPLLSTVTTPTTVATSRSVLVVRDTAATAPEAGVIIPVTAGPREAGLLTSDELAALTAPDGTFTEILAAVRGTNAILAIDPAIPAAIRALGTSAPVTATEWLTQLFALPNDRFALQFGDADVATQIHAGLSLPLRPTTLAPYLDASAVATETPSPTATPSAAGGTDTDTTTDALLDIGAATPRVYWPASGSAGNDVVTALGNIDDSTTLVPSSTVDTATGGHARAGDADLLVYDSATSAALTKAAGVDGSERAALLAEASAYAALQQAQGRPLLVTVDRPAVVNEAALRDVILAVETDWQRTSLTLSGFLAQDAAAVGVAEIPADEARVDTFNALRADAQTLDEFSSILEDPALLTGPERASILQLLGNGWRNASAQWPATIAAHRESTTETLGAVAIVPPTPINLWGSNAPLSFSVRNELPWPVSLVIVARPAGPLLIVQNTTSFTAGANQVTRVGIPVQARVGSGESSLDLQLRSTTSVPVGEPVSVEISVRAEWESVGIVILSVLVGALLFLGVIRTILKARGRSRRRRGDGRRESVEAAP